MLNVDESVIRADVYEEFRETLFVKLGKIFNNQSMAKEVANRILLSSLKDSNLDILKNKLNVIINTASDKYLNELQLYCYRYALKLSGDPELAQDVSQESLLALFRNSGNIIYIKGWLKSTVYHQVLSTWRKMKKDKYLIAKLEEQGESHQDLSIVTEKELLQNLPSEMVKELLSEEDFHRSEIINSFDNLKDYAAAEGISYYTARKHRHIIYRNLKATYINSQGWNANPGMLSFKQYDNLRRFMKTLVEASNNNQIHQLSGYCAKINVTELKAVISQVKQISDWGIKVQKKNIYNLSIADRDDISSLVYLTIEVPDKGTIRILAAWLVKCGGKFHNPTGKKIPLLNKGFIGMSMKKLEKYLGGEVRRET